MLFPLYGRRDGVRLALGLHPLEVTKVDLARELALFASFASHTSYIGEIGLDFSREGRGTRAEQERALEAILGTPGVPEKLLSVHSRGAAREVVAALASVEAARGILHWFSGPIADVDTALDAGLFFSINPSMTRSAKGRTIVARLPKERVLVETDGPYSTVGGKTAEPRDVWSVIDYLSKYWQMERTATASLVETNLRQLLFGLTADASPS
jgi:TatD DNase family protein